MRTLLVLNAGSSSVKFAAARGRDVVLRGAIDHFGRSAEIQLAARNRRRTTEERIPNLRSAFSWIRTTVKELEFRPDAVAHRIVHGGEKLVKPALLTPSVLRYLHNLVPIAPLHQPANLMGVVFAKKTWPKAVQWGVFDTAIYRSLPAWVRTYALPRGLAERLHIEKFGFHGIAHEWSFRQAAARLHVLTQQLSAVTAHLGSGASMTLWSKGRPADTTMGFTPLEGLVMATRSGDIDPAIPLYIQERLGWSAQKVQHLLEEHAGLVGVSGMRDMRDILHAAGYPVRNWPRRQWNSTTRKKARLALDMYIYHVRRTLAGYLGMVSRVRAVIFSGPIGENVIMQKLILRDLPAARGIRTLSIHTDEEQAIMGKIPLR